MNVGDLRRNSGECRGASGDNCVVCSPKFAEFAKLRQSSHEGARMLLVRPVTCLNLLVVRVARPTSLAIWHRGHSHRRPNRSQSPNRRHFASLDLKEHPDFSHRRPTSQDFRRLFFWHFPVISDQENVFSHRQRKKNFFASLATNSEERGIYKNPS